MTTKAEPPQIESLKFSELVVDTLYSGRDKKEITANAKDLAPQLADGWDVAQPGQYFIGDDDKKYVVAGFTRIEAAKLAGHKSGYFVQTNGDAVFHLTACLRTNSGKPVSRKSKGERFIMLRDGMVADDFKGAIADPKNKADWKRQPMELKEIAELPGVGLSYESIRQCIAIAESSPEIAQLIEDGSVSLNIVVTSKQLAKGDDDRQLKILKKCVSIAKADGKDKATEQHFKEAKAELYPPKLIADTPPEDKKGGKGAETKEKDAGGQPEKEKQGSSDESERQESPEVEPEGLFKEMVQHVAKTDVKAALVAIISKWSDETGQAPTENEIEQLADSIIEAKLPI